MSPETPLGCDSFWDFSYFWWPWQLWGILVGYFVERSSVGICLNVFLWLDLDHEFLGWRLQRKVPFSSHRIKDTYCQHDLSVLAFTSNTWLRQFVRFVHSKITNSSPPAFPYCFREIRPSAVKSERHARQQEDLTLPHPCRVWWTDGSGGRGCGGSESGWLTFLRLGMTPGLVSSFMGDLGECLPAVHLLLPGPSWSRCTGCRRLLATEGPGSPYS